MITTLVLILFYIVFLTIPGYLFARKITNNFLIRIFISFCLSAVFLTIFSFFEGWFGIRYFVIFLIAFLNFLFLIKKYYKDFFTVKIKLSNLDFLNMAIILLGVVFQGLILFKSGRLYDFGVGYWGPLARDGVWHEAVIGQLIRQIPPENPGLSGSVLVNYHYFYDILVAQTQIVTNVSIQTLLYRYYPILISLFLGVGSYVLSKVLFKKRESTFFVLFFTYFGSSFGWIVEFFRSRSFGGESAFWANQPVSLNINPPFAISLIFIILLMYLFVKILKDNKFSEIVFVIIGSSLIGFKVYAGILFLIAFCIVSIQQFFQTKKPRLLILFLVTSFFSLVIFLLQVKGAVGLVEFHPFWFLDSMIDLTDRVGWLKLASARTTYLQEKNWIKYFSAETLSLAIFVIGNLGTRIFGLVVILKIIWIKMLKVNEFSLIFFMSAFAFLFPLLFVQKGNPWNTIQFFYYLMYFAGLFAGLAIYEIYQKKTFASFLMILLVFVITPISSVATFRSGLYPKPPAAMSSLELEGLKFLSKKDGGSILVHPFEKEMRGMFAEPFPLFSYAPNAYVSAYTKHPTYLEDIEQQLILNNNFIVRSKLSANFFETKDVEWSNNFLKGEKISFIYLPKTFQLPMAEEEYDMTKIFENDGVNIYQVK